MNFSLRTTHPPDPSLTLGMTSTSTHLEWYPFFVLTEPVVVWAEMIVAKALNGEDTTPIIEHLARSGVDAEELLKVVESILGAVNAKIEGTPAEDLPLIDDLADVAKHQ